MRNKVKTFAIYLTTILSAVGLTVFSSTAQAQAWVPGDDYPSKWRNVPKDSIADDWRHFNRECTSWVSWALHSRNGYEMPFHDNANQWGIRAQALGVTVNMIPAVGSVAWWEKGYHVAWVSAIKGDNVTIEEYNAIDANRDGEYDGTYGTRTIHKDSVSGYIHFADLSPVPTEPTRPNGTPLVGDVNGDRRADAVVVFRDSGTAMVAASTGSRFGQPTSWAYLHTVNADKYSLADVNGDNMADLLAFWTANGRWRVSLSSGSGFWPEQDWAMGHGIGTSQQWVAKVNNDNLADIVTFDAATGDWWVSASSGNGFWPPQRWSNGHGVGSTSQVVADFTGDGKADTGVWFTNGNWHIAKSIGNSFIGHAQWSARHGLGSDERLVGDVNGDNMADTAYFFTANGHWDVGKSSGSGFWAPTAWAHGHGVSTTEQFLAKIGTDTMADLITFDRVTGDWWVSQSSGNGFWPPARWALGHGAES